MPLGCCPKKQYQSDIPCIIQQGKRFVKKRQEATGDGSLSPLISKRKNGSRHPMPAPGGFCCHGIAVREYQGDTCVLPEEICLLSADSLFLCGKPAKRLRARHMIAPVTPSSPITPVTPPSPIAPVTPSSPTTPVTPSSPITPVITVSPVSQITGRVPWPSEPGQPCCRP